jgi:dihydrofolate reductase
VLRLIAAIDEMNGVANDSGIPWQGELPTDAAYYRERTSSGLIVMGFGTYEEFAAPLHDQTNYVVVRPDSEALRPGFEGIPDVTDFLHQHLDDLVWVIGGAALFVKTIAMASQLYLTQLDGDFECTKFFPTFSDDFNLLSDTGPRVENGITFHFQIWDRAPSNPV